MFLRPRMTRYGGHAGPYVWGGVTGVTNSDNPWLTAVQENTATRLVVSGSSYDPEQRFLVNENPLSVRTALGVGLGSAGCAGPIFAPDKYGPAVWLNQVSTFSSVVATIPSGLSTTWTFTARVRSPLVASGWTRIATIQTGASQWAYIYLDGSGFIRVYPTGSGAYSSSGATPQSLLGIAAGDPFYVQIRLAATALSVFVSSDGSAWTAAGTATVTATTPHAGGLLYLGSFSTSAGMSSVFYEASLRDGDESAVKVAEFLPSMFAGGNRADGATAVDAYGVTWTIARPSTGSDIPTDNTTRLSFDGVNDFAQVVGDDTITDFVPATGLTVLLDAAFGSGAASGAVFASSANASTGDGIIISRNGANERIQGRVDDGTTVATVGDNADNITYDTRFQAAFAFGDSDHEAYVDGVSVETATDAVGSIAAAGPLRLGAEIDGSNKAAFDLYAFAVVGDDMSDTEVAATAAEGLAI